MEERTEKGLGEGEREEEMEETEGCMEESMEEMVGMVVGGMEVEVEEEVAAPHWMIVLATSRGAVRRADTAPLTPPSNRWVRGERGGGGE